MTRRPATAVAAAALTSALLLAGCGTQDALVGLRPAPPEKSVSAPLDDEGAAAIAARVLAEADAPVEGDAKAASTARAAFLAGDALTMANAEAARAGAPVTTPELAVAPEPTVVAQSQGRAWPRAIVASTLDEATNTQMLHVMISQEPDQPFRIVSSVPMFGGATLPAVAPENTGSPFVEITDGEGLPATPEQLVAAYAAALAFPKPKATTSVSVDNPFATSLKTTAAAQAKALGALGTLTQVHVPELENAVSFRLADGGVVTFGLMKRTDTLGVKPATKELVLPAEYVKLTGKKTVKKSLTLNNLESFVMVIPPTGPAEVIGGAELLVSGKGL
jgi:hypothetical protein